MNRNGKQDLDRLEDDEMLPEYDFSKAVPGYTAYRMGEDPDDERAVEGFWCGLGFEVECITEPDRRFSKAPDFLIKRHGHAVAVCEVKSMGEFDYTVTVHHEDGTDTLTRHNWRESNPERVFHRLERAKDQLDYWNENHALANIFVFVNRDPRVRSEDVASALREAKGLDATFWFEGEGEGALQAKPAVIVSGEGQLRLRSQLGLSLGAGMELTSAA